MGLSPGLSVLQLHPALNPINSRPVRLCMRLLELPVSVHRLCVMAPVQEPRRLPATDARGGPDTAFPCSGAHHASEPLASPGYVTVVQNRGGGREEVEGGGGLLYR